MVIHVFFLIHVRYDYSKTGNVCYNIYSELKKVRGVIVKKRSRIIAFLLLSVLIFTLIGSTGKNITKNVNLGLDLQGGFEVLYQVNPLDKGDKIDKDAVKSTAKTLESRVNVLGVSEPKIQVEEGNRIRVQLAGIKDQNEAREVLSTQANLTIRDAKDNVLL